MPKDRVVVGIDVGSSKICTLIATVTRDNSVHIIGVSTVPSRGLRKGQVVDIEQAVKAIGESIDGAERMAGYAVQSVYVSVGGAHIECKNSRGMVAIAGQPQGEITESDVLRVFEAAKALDLPSSREILHVIPRGYIVDSQEGIKDPIGMTGVRLEVETHVVTGLAAAMRNLAKCVQEVGVSVDGLVANPVASAEAVLSETEKELGVVLVDMGGGTTDIAMFVEGALSYTAVLPMGAKNITNDLAIGLRVSLDTAEKIKVALGREPKYAVSPENLDAKTARKQMDEIDVSDLNLAEDLKKVSRKTLVDGIIKPRLTEIFTYVGIEMKKSGLLGLTPAGIVLTGGGAETVGIVETCRHTLQMPVRVGVPTNITGLIDEVKGPSYSSSVGLLLYGARGGGDVFEQKSLGGTSGFGGFGFGSGFLGKFLSYLKSFLPS